MPAKKRAKNDTLPAATTDYTVQLDNGIRVTVTATNAEEAIKKAKKEHRT